MPAWLPALAALWQNLLYPDYLCPDDLYNFDRS